MNFWLCRIQRGFSKLVVGAGRKGVKNVFEIASAYGVGDASGFLGELVIGIGPELQKTLSVIRF